MQPDYCNTEVFFETLEKGTVTVLSAPRTRNAVAAFSFKQNTFVMKHVSHYEFYPTWYNQTLMNIIEPSSQKIDALILNDDKNMQKFTSILAVREKDHEDLRRFKEPNYHRAYALLLLEYIPGFRLIDAIGSDPVQHKKVQTDVITEALLPSCLIGDYDASYHNILCRENHTISRIDVAFSVFKNPDENIRPPGLSRHLQQDPCVMYDVYNGLTDAYPEAQEQMRHFQVNPHKQAVLQKIAAYATRLAEQKDMLQAQGYEDIYPELVRRQQKLQHHLQGHYG